MKIIKWILVNKTIRPLTMMNWRGRPCQSKQVVATYSQGRHIWLGMTPMITRSIPARRIIGTRQVYLLETKTRDSQISSQLLAKHNLVNNNTRIRENKNLTKRFRFNKINKLEMSLSPRQKSLKNSIRL